jgi:hypothetical protein
MNRILTEFVVGVVVVLDEHFPLLPGFSTLRPEVKRSFPRLGSESFSFGCKKKKIEKASEDKYFSSLTLVLK